MEILILSNVVLLVVLSRQVDEKILSSRYQFNSVVATISSAGLSSVAIHNLFFNLTDAINGMSCSNGVRVTMYSAMATN